MIEVRARLLRDSLGRIRRKNGELLFEFGEGGIVGRLRDCKACEVVALIPHTEIPEIISAYLDLCREKVSLV